MAISLTSLQPDSATNEKKKGKLPHTSPYSGGQLECRLDNCGFIIQSAQQINLHWKLAHSGGHSLSEAVFMEARTGQHRGLFDLFPYVVVCRACETIREGKQC